jgi:hypothetical protein
MVPDIRYWVYERLLARKEISAEEVSKALVDSMKADDLGDMSLPKLLLENGASPGHQERKSFIVALGLRSPNSAAAVRLLTQWISDDSTADTALNLIRLKSSFHIDVRVKLYRHLLDWSVTKVSLYRLLVWMISKGRFSDISFLKLVLSKGPDPNIGEGHCFSTVVKKRALDEFRVLSKYARRQVVLSILLKTLADEREVVKWFNVCLEESPAEVMDQDELLFQCMRQFPGGMVLLKLLLEQGVSASAKRSHQIDGLLKPEPCTAFIWALFARPKIKLSSNFYSKDLKLR